MDDVVLGQDELVEFLHDLDRMEYIAELNRSIDSLIARAAKAERTLAMQPVMPEPDWPSAPEWADWFVHEFTGYTWHEFKPWIQFDGTWRKALRGSGRRVHPRTVYVHSELPLGLDPRLSLRSRPGLVMEDNGVEAQVYP